MTRIMHCETLQEAVGSLKEEGNCCTTIAAYLYAAGASKHETLGMLSAVGFDPGESKTCTDALYTVVPTDIEERLRMLRMLLEAETGTC
ncbi:MAG: hypothetical protein ACYS8X_04585 [Planctomycetota bacterium]|jgi:hypothetical protein